MTTEIITTEDGSHSIRNVEMNETYHSIHGARQESMHVFIKNGFDYFVEGNTKEEIKIFEVGFGTGLNAWLTMLRAEELNKKISYTTVEAFPLDESIWSQLNYGDTSPENKKRFQELHQATWNKQVEISSHFNIEKLATTLQSASLLYHHFDIVFYDAFAPSKQPEMWEFAMLEKIFNAMNKGSILVTYCAKGQFKRDLKALDLTVETLPGPPGKLQMVRALNP